ncbi:MAG: DUF3034 family protein, partial [Planctomycetes bacterium]|nr:DUF3034 family protein [Planctomycetota bacterium]
MAQPAMAQDQTKEAAPPNAVRDALAAETAADQDAVQHEHKKGAPLPFHSIEGVSGGAITPMAYLCNAGPDCGCTKCSRPSAAYSFVNLGSKEMHVVSVTQVFFGCIELGYAANFLNLGSLVDDVNGAGLDMGRDSVQLHHFNLRAQLIKENSHDLPLPAVTAGIHFKLNHGIASIDDNLGKALTGIGLERQNGVDFTLTATKMFPKLAFGRPVIATTGMRFSQAAQIGLLGFGNGWKPTVEGSIATLPTDWLALAYEYRQKTNPYHKIDELIDAEDDWHALSASWVVNDRLTVTAVWGMFGNIANAREDDVLGLQIKYEF